MSWGDRCALHLVMSAHSVPSRNAMLEIISQGAKYIIRRARPKFLLGSSYEYWDGRGWSESISEAIEFDNENDAEECRVIG